MREGRGRTARRLAENLWVPARLARGTATALVATIATFALVAVIYQDVPLTGAVAPVAGASEPSATGPCPTAAAATPTGAGPASAAVPPGAGLSGGCAGTTGAAGADIPHRAGSAAPGTQEPRTQEPRTQEPSAQAEAEPSAAVAALSAGASTLADRVPSCDGDGTSGDRIAFYYGYLAGHPNRLAAVRQNLIDVIEQANDIVYQSSRDYGARQSLRIATDQYCVPQLSAIQLPARAADSFDVTVSASGLDATNRKYVLFVDTSNFCGLGTLDFDDSPGPANVNNTGPSWARVDLGCWSPQVTAHEIFHMLGAVQRSAPHYDGTGHCTDGYDLMCPEPDDAAGWTIRCPEPLMQDRLDCGGDDYYNPHPAPGSYLATHWDTADSAFLYGGGPARTAASDTPNADRHAAGSAG